MGIFGSSLIIMLWVRPIAYCSLVEYLKVKIHKVGCITYCQVYGSILFDYLLPSFAKVSTCIDLHRPKKRRQLKRQLLEPSGKPWRQLRSWRMSARLGRKKSDSCNLKKNEGRRTHVVSYWSSKNALQNAKLRTSSRRKLGLYFALSC